MIHEEHVYLCFLSDAALRVLRATIPPITPAMSASTTMMAAIRTPRSYFLKKGTCSSTSRKGSGGGRVVSGMSDLEQPGRGSATGNCLRRG